ASDGSPCAQSEGGALFVPFRLLGKDGQADHHAFHALVGKQRVGPAAEEGDGNPVIAADGQGDAQVFRILRPKQGVSAPADAQAGPVGEGNVPGDLAAEVTLDLVAKAHLPSRARSSAPTWPTSPAPRVMTRSPSSIDDQRFWASPCRGR